jgi:nucleoid-associated protein YgaU
MTRDPGKLAAVALLLIGVWAVVFWMHKPKSKAPFEPTGMAALSVSGLPVGGNQPTFDQTPDLSDAILRADRGEVVPPPGMPLQSLSQALPLAPNLAQQAAEQTRLENARAGELGRGDLGSVGPGRGDTPRLVEPTFSEHTVQRGESFATISRKYFGTSRHAEAIARANPFVSPTKLVPGRTVLKIPDDPENIQGKIVRGPSDGEPGRPAGNAGQDSSAGSGSSRTHVVREGENLGSIARRYLGSANRWKDILDANKDKLSRPERLKVGMELVIPER